jgi:hypothetical protein
MWSAATSRGGQLLDLDFDVQRQHSPGEMASGSVVRGTATGDLEFGIAEGTAARLAVNTRIRARTQPAGQRHPAR